MAEGTTDPAPRERVRALLRTRQYREFTPEPLTDAELEAIVDAARWTGSGRNEQPWRFIVVRDPATIRAIAEAGVPQTRSLHTAVAALVITLPAESPQRVIADAYDDGRAAERVLIAASMLGLGAGIAWIRPDVDEAVRPLLGLPPERMVRTILSLGHPTDAAHQPKSAPGKARLPRDETVFAERWPEG